MQPTRRRDMAFKFWLQAMPNELEGIIAVRFSLVTIIGQRTAVDLIIPKEKLVAMSATSTKRRFTTYPRNQFPKDEESIRRNMSPEVSNTKAIVDLSLLLPDAFRTDKLLKVAF